ncbi:MAG: hypothetical protein ACR2NX_10525 [Chthoniobacterales bacterium]
MSFKFSCPSCGQHIEAIEEHVGIQAACPTCSQSFHVPSPVIVQSAPPPTTPSRAIGALKAIGRVALWLAIMVGTVLLVTMFIRGGAWLSDKLYPWLVGLSALALAFSVLALLPLAAFRETRGYSGVGFYIVSYVFGVTLWVWSFLTTYVLWGGIAVIIGLLMVGVGVLPIALLATAFKGMWSLFGELLFVTVATFATRGFGLYLASRDQRYRDEQLDLEDDTLFPQRIVTATWLLLAGLFVPYLGYVALLPFITCAIILCCSKSRRARRHGRALLCVLPIMFVALVTIGFVFYQGIPDSR